MKLKVGNIRLVFSPWAHSNDSYKCNYKSNRDKDHGQISPLTQHTNIAVLLLRGCSSSSSFTSRATVILLLPPLPTLLWFFFFLFLVSFHSIDSSSSSSFVGAGCCCFGCCWYWFDVVVWSNVTNKNDIFMKERIINLCLYGLLIRMIFFLFFFTFFSKFVFFEILFTL